MEYFNRDVEKCCWCCELRTGNIILGVTNAVFSACSVLAGFLSQGYDEETSTDEAYSAETIMLLIVFMCKFVFDLLFVYGVVKGLQRIVKAYYIMYMVFIWCWVLLIVVCIILLQWRFVIGLFLHLIIDGYAFIACRSYYRKLLVHEIV